MSAARAPLSAAFPIVLLGLVACADGADGPTPDGARIAIAVGALAMPDIDAACYDLRVRGAAGVIGLRGDPALSAADGDTAAICSDRYGSGPAGDIAYVAPCDASAAADLDPALAGTQNEVTLWVDGLYLGPDPEAGGALSPVAGAWQNPCGPSGCDALFTCRENADTAVSFDFTILRQGETGFFDIVVDFGDIYCASKVDCRQANATPEPGDDPVLRLVSGADGDKLPTVVFAVACSAGLGDEGTTRLYMSDLRIDCDGEDDDLLIPVDQPDRVFAEDPPGVVAQAFVFQGEDNLVADDRVYWNVAVGLQPADDADPFAPVFAATGCVLSASATAAGGDVNVALGGANVAYPYIRAEVPLTDEAGALVCTRHPVNETDALATVYSDLDGLPAEIVWEMSMVPEGGVTVGPYVPATPAE